MKTKNLNVECFMTFVWLLGKCVRDKVKFEFVHVWWPEKCVNLDQNLNVEFLLVWLPRKSVKIKLKFEC